MSLRWTNLHKNDELNIFRNRRFILLPAFIRFLKSLKKTSMKQNRTSTPQDQIKKFESLSTWYKKPFSATLLFWCRNCSCFQEEPLNLQLFRQVAAISLTLTFYAFSGCIFFDTFAILNIWECLQSHRVSALTNYVSVEICK